jgi:predicted acetyltransferase
MRFRPTLLVSDNGQRIDARRAKRRERAGQERDHHHDADRSDQIGRVGRSEPEEQIRDDARGHAHGDERRDGASGESDRHDHQRVTQGLPDDGPSVGAKCTPDAELPGPLRDVGRRHAEDTHAGERPSEHAEERADRRHQALFRDVPVHRFAHGADPDEELRMDGLDGFADRRRDRLRVARRAHHEGAEATRSSRDQEHQGADLAAHAEELDVSHDANNGGCRDQRIGIRIIVFRDKPAASMRTRGIKGAPRWQSMDLVLRVPKEAEEDEFLRAHRATSPGDPTFLHYYEEGMSFLRYLEVLAERERGENLPPNHVPSTFLFAFAGSRIVGRVSIRHFLNPFLERVGGHIGYVVAPEYRRRGYATIILSQSLLIARQKLGLERVLVTCDDDNVGSIKTIENNGGVLETIVVDPHRDKPKRRYWIDTAG